MMDKLAPIFWENSENSASSGDPLPAQESPFMAIPLIIDYINHQEISDGFND